MMWSLGGSRAGSKLAGLVGLGISRISWKGRMANVSQLTDLVYQHKAQAESPTRQVRYTEADLRELPDATLSIILGQLLTVIAINSRRLILVQLKHSPINYNSNCCHFVSKLSPCQRLPRVPKGTNTKEGMLRQWRQRQHYHQHQHYCTTNTPPKITAAAKTTPTLLITITTTVVYLIRC